MSEITATVHVGNSVRKMVDRDSSRYAIGSALLTPIVGESDRVFVTATDGRVCGIVEADGHADREQYIPYGVMPTAKRGATLSLNGKWESSAGKFADTQCVEDSGRWPRAEGVFDDIEMETARVIELDAELLVRLANMIRGDSKFITLMIPEHDKDDGIVMRGVPVVGDDGIGVIMPGGFTAKCPKPTERAERYAATVAAYKSSRSDAEPVT